VIGDADAKHAMRDQRDELAAPTSEVEIIEQAGNGTTESTGTESKGKSSKRSKRKG
jgi:hypothetical protein